MAQFGVGQWSDRRLVSQTLLHRTPACHSMMSFARQQCRPRPWGVRCRRSFAPRTVAAFQEGELVSSEQEFLDKVSQHEGPVIVDWMAKWCRKCIYLKPKLEKMIHEEFPDLSLVFIDVNSVPGNLVYGHGIKKMPTITIHHGGTKVREHIAAEAGLKAITNIRAMINDYMEHNAAGKQQLVSK